MFLKGEDYSNWVLSVCGGRSIELWMIMDSPYGVIITAWCELGYKTIIRSVRNEVMGREVTIAVDGHEHDGTYVIPILSLISPFANLACSWGCSLDIMKVAGLQRIAVPVIHQCSKISRSVQFRSLLLCFSASNFCSFRAWGGVRVCSTRGT